MMIYGELTNTICIVPISFNSIAHLIHTFHCKDRRMGEEGRESWKEERRK
jgi:hypothetical protein